MQKYLKILHSSYSTGFGHFPEDKERIGMCSLYVAVGMSEDW